MPAVAVGSAATALTASQLASCMVSGTEQPYTMQDFASGRPGRYSDLVHITSQLVRLHVTLQLFETTHSVFSAIM